MAMADGYAQASGELAVLNLHVAPGLGNAMGMLYDAMKANAPVLVTAGQQDLEYIVAEPVLTADLPTLARPFVKWAAEVHRVEDLPVYVHRAVKTALAPPTGPVFLALPGDILKNDADIDLLEPTRVAPRIRGDADAVAAAADLLAKAERPVIIAGDAVAQSRAHKELVALAEAIAAPVYVEFIPSTASFPASHPLYRGMMTRTQAGVREVLDKHDLVFSVGGDLFTWSLPSNIKPMAGRIAAHPSRHRSVADRQELSGAGRDPGRPEGDAARYHRGAECAHDGERQGRRERAAESRHRDHQERPRGVPRQSARHGGQDAGAAAGAARSHRRHAAEGCGRDRGGPVVRRPAFAC